LRILIETKTVSMVTSREAMISAEPQHGLNKLERKQAQHIRGLIRWNILKVPGPGIDPIDWNLQCEVVGREPGS
jgi:hypothetical protein